MKLTIVVLLSIMMLMPSLTFADRRYGHPYDMQRHEYPYYPRSPRHHHRNNNNNNYEWVLPAIIGGAIVYEITRPRTVYVETLPPPPYGYRYERVYDRNCYCYRTILVYD